MTATERAVFLKEIKREAASLGLVHDKTDLEHLVATGLAASASYLERGLALVPSGAREIFGLAGSYSWELAGDLLELLDEQMLLVEGLYDYALSEDIGPETRDELMIELTGYTEHLASLEGLTEAIALVSSLD